MKTRRIFSIVLSLAIALGALALLPVTASAASLEEFTSIIEPAAADRLDLPVRVSADQITADGDFDTDRYAFIREAELVLDRVTCLPGYTAIMELSYVKKAYMPGKTQEALGTAFAVVFDEGSKYDDLVLFANNESAQKMPYAFGTLRSKLLSMATAAAEEIAALSEPLAKEYFTAEALAYANDYAKFREMVYVVETETVKKTLTQEQRTALGEKLYIAVSPVEFQQQQQDILNTGDFAKASKLALEAAKALEKLLLEFGLITAPPPAPAPNPKPNPTPKPSFFAKVWAFIVKWIFFGWLWNK